LDAPGKDVLIRTCPGCREGKTMGEEIRGMIMRRDRMAKKWLMAPLSLLFFLSAGCAVRHTVGCPQTPGGTLRPEVPNEDITVWTAISSSHAPGFRLPPE